MVEEHLADHPDLADVAVIGTAHERWVEQVTAVVVPNRAGLTPGDRAVVRHHPEPARDAQAAPHRRSAAAYRKRQARPPGAAEEVHVSEPTERCEGER
jgi:acyl-CoA synthetase (AMP-forming)/AMP-acid ligase II